MVASFLYLGAGSGVFLLELLRHSLGREMSARRLARGDLPYLAGMVLLDIAALILLMVGLSRTTAANAALLNNFEIVATALFARIFFRELIGPRLWAAIGLITVSSILLTFSGAESLHFSAGSLFVLLGCVCWGFENNCTRALSACDPFKIVIIKGFGSGLGSLAVALILGESLPAAGLIPVLLLLGFVSYGLSIFFYVYAQRDLGAARTSAYYAVAPFFGAALSLVIFREAPGVSFSLACLLMLAGACLACKR